MDDLLKLETTLGSPMVSVECLVSQSSPVTAHLTACRRSSSKAELRVLVVTLRILSSRLQTQNPDLESGLEVVVQDELTYQLVRSEEIQNYTYRLMGQAAERVVQAVAALWRVSFQFAT